MADKERKQGKEIIHFTSAWEAPGYISLNQALTQVTVHAPDNTEIDRRQYAGQRILWEVSASRQEGPEEIEPLGDTDGQEADEGASKNIDLEFVLEVVEA